MNSLEKQKEFKVGDLIWTLYLGGIFKITKLTELETGIIKARGTQVLSIGYDAPVVSHIGKTFYLDSCHKVDLAYLNRKQEMYAKSILNLHNAIVDAYGNLENSK